MIRPINEATPSAGASASDEPDVVDGEGVTQSGVDVQKVLHTSRFEVPSLVYRIESTRDAPVRIRIGESVPDEVPIDAIGFHDDYEGQHWRTHGSEALEYVRELDSNESTITVWGVQTDDEKRRLREELNLRLSESASSFVDHLQNSVEQDHSRLESRLESLEGSVDELYGLKADAREVERLDETTDSLESAVSMIDEQAATIDEVETVRDAVVDLDARTPDEAVVDELTAALQELDRSKAEADSVADLEERVRSLDEAKAEVEDVSALRDCVGGLDDRTADVDRVADLSDDHEALATRVDELVDRTATETQVGDLAEELDRVERVSAEVDEVAALEREIDAKYVQESDVSTTIERKFDERLRELAPVGGVIALVSLGVGLAVGNPFLGVAVVLLGGTLGAGWWSRRQGADPFERS